MTKTSAGCDNYRCRFASDMDALQHRKFAFLDFCSSSSALSLDKSMTDIGFVNQGNYFVQSFSPKVKEISYLHMCKR